MAAYKKSDPFYHSGEWLAVKKAALERDHYICQTCLEAYRQGRRKSPRTATIVHHIIPRKDRPDLALCLDNLQSICSMCHNQVHPEKGGHGADRQKKMTPPKGVRVIKI